MDLKNKKFTYISLFSSAGIGCFGFKECGFQCVATVEVIKRRLELQKINEKCKYESGYINDDICLVSTKNKIKEQIDFWKVNENIDNIDVLIATPPCQGMSNANSKKNENDIFRNSLVVESIKLVDEIKPNFFIFENVPLFMKTECISRENRYKIGEYIYEKLSKNYSIYHNVINFKDYGVPSSRKRCIVIGVKNTLSDFISPLELFPNFENKCITLKESIYKFPRLHTMGQIDSNDIYHFFRSYEPKMREWISDLKPGMSAYENKDDYKKPHKIVDGKIVINQNKMGGKYKRQDWNNVGPCIHTRNDQLASQNTIHPEDDRVFSIRELMILMTIPNSFKWSTIPFDELNALTYDEKKSFLKKNEINIRQVIGEAVPTLIFSKIANNIKSFLINTNQINEIQKLEFNNPNRYINEAFYTNKFIVNEIVKNMPSFDNKDEINILEPSVGLGSFLFLLFKKYEKHKKVNIDVIDIDKNTIINLKKILKNKMPSNVNINFHNNDFLMMDFFNKKYDLVIGNPPFMKITNKKYIEQLDDIFGKQKDKNIISYFLLKAMSISNYFCFILPKNFLIAPQYNQIRSMISSLHIKSIFDFENYGFKKVVIETIALFVKNVPSIDNEIKVINFNSGKITINNKSYITDNTFPNWIIYRNEKFDLLSKKLKLDVFNVYRDRQLTNRFLTRDKNKGTIKVLRSRNLSMDRKIVDIDNYDSYLVENFDCKKIGLYKYLNHNNSYICPNFTYNIRVIKKPNNVLVNGSLAILTPKENVSINDKDLLFFSSNEFKEFYSISNNRQKNTVNLDKNSIFYFGILNE